MIKERKLKLKHLAPYLPYQLGCCAMGEGKTTFEFQGITDVNWVDLHEIGRTVCGQYDIDDVFPILRPLSDIIKDEYNFIYKNETDYESIYDWINLDSESMLKAKFSFEFWSELFHYHFDVFGLIEARLAIDINTLNK